MTTPDAGSSGASARERVLAAAYELFSRRGIRAVGTDEVIARAGVARATLYRHFATKNDLVLAVLQRREELWTYGLIEEQSRLRGATPEEQLLAIFDVMDEWFRQGDRYEGCSFINVLLELGQASGREGLHRPHRPRPRHRAPPRGGGGFDRRRGLRVVLAHPDEGRHRAGRRRRPDAARRARRMARTLIEEHRPPLVSDTGEAV